MAPFDRHVFVCEHRRPEGDARGCCAAKDSSEIRERLKAGAKAAGLQGRVRVNTAGCLDHCAHGATIVVYPEAVWYGGVTLEDVDEILQSHLVEGKPVERLRLPRARPDRT
jgi:(2Fe-2S) ferredoxin